MKRWSLVAFSLAALGSVPVRAASNDVAFTPSREDFPNPERGFYRAGGSDLAQTDRAFFDRVFADGYRLVYARVDLSRFRTTPISAAYLAAMDQGFQAARSAGVKLIVRAVYNYPQGETGYQAAQDAALPIVLGHLAQLKPLLARNVGVIAYVQAGFIGAWGEWHTSSNDLTTTATRARIRDAILDAVPADRFVQFRYPPDLDHWTAPVMPSLGQTLAGGLRTGFHNDCFLASQTDVGTFPEEAEPREKLQARMANLTALAPFGGETCNPADDLGAISRSDCADVVRESARYHLTYLNADYYRGLFHDRWKSQGCLDEVSRRMGYRLVLTGARVAPEARRGSALRVDVTVSNEGWARIYNRRTVEVVLVRKIDRKAYRIPVDADPRSWLPGVTATTPLRVPLPPTMEPGVYDIALALPDPAKELAHDPRYAIRFANADAPVRNQRWAPIVGAYFVGLKVTVR
ncbi:DUF4832 domain-containing protein [Sphingomonas endolithica]|uniref:DUF4832 domain-containing protein n=1 Tax=Sphingomonas endolithica TaxID=2972485 RepID=UPI0021B07E81|nr:DUF4832 domain-containing protein [Sphingomonas sp. ZFBP2030]